MPLHDALQCAQLAEDEGAPAALIAAALLHDVAQRSDEHARMDAKPGSEQMLAKWFGPDVCEPVRLLPAARRYLSAVEPGHLDGLSPSARDALKRAGGPMSASETAAFDAEPYAGDALRLLRWKDRGSTGHTETARLPHFLCYAVGCMRWGAQ